MVPVPSRPWIGVTLGDPAGIGPEIVRAAFADERLRKSARLVGLGGAAWAPPGLQRVDAASFAALARSPELDRAWIDTGGATDVAIGSPSEAGGRVALAALRAGHELAARGDVAALVTAPVSKESLHLAGERVEGQTSLFARWDGASEYQMLAVAGPLRVMLLSRHVPLREALAAVTSENVERHLALLARALEDLGFPRPRLALAGLNPHAGENGILGREELDVLGPALANARRRGLDVTGPVSPDSVFLQASRGEFDGVLALYHDQAFIPVKLLAPGTALTVIAGLSYLRVSPAHGTAFDIAGSGRARPENLIASIEWAAERRRV